MRAAPSEGEANAALCRLLAKALGIPPGRVAIVGGATSRLKRVKVDGRRRGARAPRWRRSRARQSNVMRAPRSQRQGQHMTARIIDGKAIAAELRAAVAARSAAPRARACIVPGLAVVLVGENPASAVYVRNKSKQTVEAGMRSFDHKLARGRAESEVLALVDKLNADPAVHGILVQLPLPKQIDSQKVLNAIDPAKGRGRIPSGQCRPALDRIAGADARARRSAASISPRSVHRSLEGMEAVVVGRSNIVGKPLLQLLLNENATVTVAHSRTRDLPAVCRRADLLFAAVGRPEMVRGDWIKPGATVIDVGINRITGGDGKNRIVGDVAFAEAARGRGRDHAGAGRRRADDHRVPAGEHRARGLRDPWIAEAGGMKGFRMFRQFGHALIALALVSSTRRRPDDRNAIHDFRRQEVQAPEGQGGRGLRLLAVPGLSKICTCC